MAAGVDKAEPPRGPVNRSRRIPDDEYEIYRPRILGMYLKEIRAKKYEGCSPLRLDSLLGKMVLRTSSVSPLEASR